MPERENRTPDTTPNTVVGPRRHLLYRNPSRSVGLRRLSDTHRGYTLTPYTTDRPDPNSVQTQHRALGVTTTGPVDLVGRFEEPSGHPSDSAYSPSRGQSSYPHSFPRSTRCSRDQGVSGGTFPERQCRVLVDVFRYRRGSVRVTSRHTFQGVVSSSGGPMECKGYKECHHGFS